MRICLAPWTPPLHLMSSRNSLVFCLIVNIEDFDLNFSYLDSLAIVTLIAF